VSEEIARLHLPAAEVSADALKRAEQMIEREEGIHNRLKGALAAFVVAVAVVMSIFHLYTAYAIVRPEHLRAIHVAFVLFLTFLIFPVARRFRHRVMWWDWVLAAAGVATSVYLIAGGDEFFDRSIVPNDWDIVFGVALVLLILEAMRRTTGWILPFITVCFLLYAFFGAYLPAPWTHKGYELPRLIGHMYMTLEGIYGTAIAVSSSLIVLFTIYGAFLQFSGAGKFYIDFSFAAMGGKPTSAGRTVTLASFLLGGPSGSGVATTVTLGAVAAPMLAKVGYSKNEAGGLLAAGGLGAIISPPVLGAAAFLIAEFLKISYLDVVLMATIPTCLYYLALFIMVEIDVRKFGMKDVVFEQVESAWSLTKKYWFHFLSLISIVVFMLLGFSPELSVFWATVVAFATSFLHRDTALLSYDLLRGRNPLLRGFFNSRFITALDGGSRAVLNVAATCAGAGLIVGVVTLTGLGLKFSSIVLAYAGNSLLLTAIYTALIVWIVGLAVPVTASYIICAVIAAPALIVLKVPEYAAHMFVFYYAVLEVRGPGVPRAVHVRARSRRQRTPADRLDQDAGRRRLGLDRAGHLHRRDRHRRARRRPAGVALQAHQHRRARHARRRRIPAGLSEYDIRRDRLRAGRAGGGAAVAAGSGRRLSLVAQRLRANRRRRSGAPRLPVESCGCASCSRPTNPEGRNKWHR
jgi:TRAP transporter 4TM/12TM fusion protein